MDFEMQCRSSPLQKEFLITVNVQINRHNRHKLYKILDQLVELSKSEKTIVSISVDDRNKEYIRVFLAAYEYKYIQRVKREELKPNIILKLL